MKRLPTLRGALAASAVMAFTLCAHAAPELVVDVATGQVIHAEEATRPWFPASTTKLMTAYVALRAIKAGQISLDTPLIASSRASAQPPSKIGIRPGQEITLDNALKILMVKSANDLAVVVAEGVGGSLDNFANLMNAEAARLGMHESHFRNPHGFMSEGHVTSARDLAILGRALLVDFPEFRDYWGIGAVKLGSRVMKNTNGLIGRYPGAEGMKTGFICASGFNVVALANRGGRTMMAVVMGSGSGAERTIRTAQLLDKGFASWSGSHGSLTSLPGSGYGSAPNMRNEICRKGRQLFLGEEEDTGGAIAIPQTDSSSVYALMNPVQTPSAARSVGSASTGRPMLGARADLIPIPVSLGRTPGSSEVARGPGNGAVMPRTATAFAPARAAPAPQPAAAAIRAPARPQPVEGSETEPTPQRATGSPLQLPGVFTSTAPGAIGLRTPAPGAIRPGAKAAVQAPKAGAITAKAADKKTTPGKIAAAPTKAKVAAAKVTTTKIDPKKAQPKKKAAAADDE